MPTQIERDRLQQQFHDLILCDTYPCVKIYGLENQYGGVTGCPNEACDGNPLQV
jgi:hypothetical protein